MVRAVRRMAVHAILYHRLVLEQVRPRFSSVTLEALVVYREGVNQLRAYRPMRVMAVRTGQLTLPYRNGGWSAISGPGRRRGSARRHLSRRPSLKDACSRGAPEWQFVQARLLVSCVLPFQRASFPP